MCRQLHLLVLIVYLSGSSFFKIAEAASMKDAVDFAARDVAFFLKERGVTKITPKFSGVLTFPGGNTQGFVEQLKESLAPHGIQISSRAEYAFDAHLERSDDPSENAFRLRLSGQIVDGRGRNIHDVKGKAEIDDGRDLAEATGVSVHFGPLKDDLIPGAVFKKQLDEKTIYNSADQTILYSNQSGFYGVSVRPLNGSKRRFLEKEEGLAYTDLKLGEEFVLILINNSDHEAAVNVKLDGVNTFHFCDESFRERKPNGTVEPKYSRWIVKPRSQSEVIGWFKNDKRTIRFKISPIEEGAAAKAGIPPDEVGLITAEFSASWVGDAVPKDEERILRTVTAPPRTVKRAVTEEVIQNGKKVIITRMVEEALTSTMETSVGFGEEVITNAAGVTRTISGKPRATIAFRYQR